MAPNKNNPHVLIFPYPSQGPLNCMTKLAELLAIAGLHVTLLNTDDNRRRLCLSSSSLPANPLLRFKSIPDGLPEDKPRDATLLINVAESLNMNSRHLLRDLILTMRSEDNPVDGFPPVTCAIADGFLPFFVDLAEEIGLPCLSFRTPSACSIWAYLCIPKLMEIGELPFKEGDDLDEPVKGVPGMEGFLRRRDLPEFFRAAKGADDPELKFMVTASACSRKARGFILNTTEVLESTAIDQIRSQIPVTYAVGPLHAILKSYRAASGIDVTPHTSSLWQEDTTCLKWLDSQPDKSVVYVSFGSLTTLTRDELHEFYYGLVGSGHKVLWVLRPDMLRGPEWTDEIKRLLSEEQGMIISWAPQQKVLAHRAVGCFLTHSGWNSTLESIIEGVPMLCWPFFLDQQINSRFVSEVWQIGLDMKNVRDREVVARMVREMMEGESATRFRQSAHDMADAVKKSIAEGGSSFKEFQRLIEDIKSMSSSLDLS